MTKIVVLTMIILLISLALHKQTLTILINLELLVLLLIILSLLMGIEIFFSMILICVGACEGAVGLRALIRLNRMKGAVMLGQ